MGTPGFLGFTFGFKEPPALLQETSNCEVVSRDTMMLAFLVTQLCFLSKHRMISKVFKTPSDLVVGCFESTWRLGLVQDEPVLIKL